MDSVVPVEVVPSRWNRWLKRFGGFGLGLFTTLGLGLSVLSQGGGAPVVYNSAHPHPLEIDTDWPKHVATFTFASG